MGEVRLENARSVQENVRRRPPTLPLTPLVPLRTIALVNANADSRRTATCDVALFLALALLFRLFYLFAMPRILDTADAVHYLDTAEHFASGDFFGFNPKIPVLYPLLAAMAHFLVRDYEWACNIVSLVASTLLIIPLYGLARDLHGRSTARTAALLAAVWPWLIDYACRVAPDALGCTLWFLSIWLLARGMRRGGAWLVAAPFAFFALHLTRPEGTALVAAAVVGGIFLSLDPATFRVDRQGLKRLGLFVVPVIVLLVVHAVYMRMVTGQTTMNYRAQFVVRDFDLVLMLSTAVKTFAEVLPLMLGPALLLFIGVGFFHRDTERNRDFRLEAFVLWFALCQWGLSLFVLSAEPRYLMSVIVTLSIWSARGMVLVARDAAGLRWGRVLRLLPAAFAISLMLAGTAITVGAEHIGQRAQTPHEYKEVGRWMKENLEPGLIFTRKPQVGYYAGMQTAGPDLTDTLDEAIARAKRMGARYMVVDERNTAQMVRGIAPLLDPANAPPSLRLLKEFSQYPQSRVVVYEIVGPAGEAPGGS